MAEGAELGEYYTLPVILSMRGIDKQVNSTLGKAFHGAGVQGGKELAKGVKSSEADIKKAFDNHAKLADKAADATDKLKVAQAGYDELVKKGVTEGKRYEAAIAAKNKATRDEARAVKTATDALTDYKKAAKQAESAGQDASGGFLSGLRGAAAGAGTAGSDAAASFADGFAGSSAIMGLVSRTGPIGATIAAVGTIMGGVLIKNVMAGVEREPGRDLIQAQLGADDATIIRLGKETGAIYARNFGASRDEVMQAGKLAIQQGLIDPKASSATWDPVIEKLLAINQLVGGDLVQTTNTVRTLWKSGVTKDIEGAFDVITAASQRGLGDDIMDSLTEYAAGWKNAGLDAEQAMALIKQAQENGVDNSDRSADALREFGRRVTEEGPKMVEILDAIGLNGQAMYDKFKKGGPEAFQAFDTVFDKIRAIQDPVDRNQAAMALLGDTAGDFIGAFSQWDPSAAVAGFGRIDGAAQQASDTLGDNVVGSFEEAKRTINVALDGVQDSLAEAFGPTLQGLAAGVVKHKDTITGAFVTLGEVGISLGAEMVRTVGGITEAIGQLAGGIGNIQGSVLKFQAWQADIRGDGEVADELRRQSEEAYGWGDSLEASGTSMIKTADDLDKLKRKLRDTTDDTDDAETSVGNLGQSFGKLNDEVKALPATLPSWFSDLASGKPGQLPILAPGSDPFAIPGGAAPTIPGLVPTGGGGSGVGINLQASKLPQGGAPVIPPGATREQVIAGLAARARAEGLSEAEVAGVLALAQTESNFDQTGFLGFSTKTVDTGYTGGAAYANDFNKAMDQFFNNYKEGGLAQAGGPEAKDTAIQALNSGDTDAFLDWMQYGIQGAVPGAGGNYNHEFGPNIRKFFDQWAGGAAPSSSPSTPTSFGGANSVSGVGTGQTVAGVDQLAALMGQMFPGVNLGGWRPSDGPNTPTGHQRGVALDIGIQDQAMGDQINEFIRANAAQLGVKSTIWRDQWKDFKGNQSTVGGHQDHVHVEVDPAAATDIGQALATSVQTGTGPSGSPSLVNAFGADYKPGIGTPGYNEYGEPGYYETDPRRLAQANRGVQDSKQRIADTETAITDADTSLADALKERDRIAKMTEVQRVTEGEDLDKANADVERAQKQAERARLDATRAKEDAQWAVEDLKEAEQGSFKTARQAKKSGKGGSDDLSGIGGIFSSFLTETFGLDGSLFPDIGNLMPLKMAGTLIGALTPQQDESGAITTSGGAFGMPDITAPPMPAPGVHPGTGAAPGPGNTTIINAGNNFNGQVGLSPQDIEKQRQASVDRAIQRIPVGS